MKQLSAEKVMKQLSTEKVSHLSGRVVLPLQVCSERDTELEVMWGEKEGERCEIFIFFLTESY